MQTFKALKQMGRLGLALVAVGLFGACASTPAPQPVVAAPPPSAPEWIHKSTYIEGRSLFGVGVVAGVRNRGLAHSAAGNRARAELSKLMEVYTATLMKDYSASISTGDLNNSSEEQSITQVTKTFSRQLQRGVQITGMYIDDQQGIIYALAELNLDRAQALAAARSQMSSRMQEWLGRNQDQVLERVEQSEPDAEANE